MRAYPASYRARYEDEMVAVLLDTTARRPTATIREATAIITAGLATRLRAAGEVHHGLRLASLGAAATIVAIATVALSVAIPQAPAPSGALPATSWIATVAITIFAIRSESRFRVVPAALIVLTMFAAGPDLLGFKRSVLAVAALCVLFTSITRRAEWRPVIAATTVGVCSGLLFGIPNRTALDNWAPLTSGPWTANAHWQYTAYSLDTLAGWLAASMVIAGLLTLRWRPRYLMAATTLTIALWFPAALTPGGYFWVIGFHTRELLTTASTILAVAVLGLAIIVPSRLTR
jgi:hypothetical protein